MYPRALEPTAGLPGRALIKLFLMLILLAAVLPSYPSHFQLPLPSAVPAPHTFNQNPSPSPVTLLEQLPLAFIPNMGQIDPHVAFQAQALGGSVALTATGLTLMLPLGQPVAAPHPIQRVSSDLPSLPAIPPSVVQLIFEGAQTDTQIEGLEQSQGVVNLYQGNDSTHWRSGLPAYTAAVYRELYPGIDLRYDGTSTRLKGTYTLAPRADPSRIRWRYTGIDQVKLDPATGDLLLTLPVPQGQPGTLVERAPIAWQEANGQRRDVSIRYVLTDNQSIGFAVGHYDLALPLIIDPTLEYGSYLGGSASDTPGDLLVDAEGNIVVIGSTTSYDFPRTQAEGEILPLGEQSAFVTKISADGKNLLFSTVFGGTGFDHGKSAALDQNGNIVVLGTTQAPDIPVKQALYSSLQGPQDAFVSVLDANGILQFNTYFGGTRHESGKNIAVDGENNIIIAGNTTSLDLPIIGGIQPVFSGGVDVFIAKLNNDRDNLVFSTYFGGTGVDRSMAMVIDQGNTIFVTGDTESSDIPIKSAVQSDSGGGIDAFVMNISPDGLTLRSSTYLGGSKSDYPWDLHRDQVGNMYLVGWTDSSNYPVVNALQSRLQGEIDAFVIALNPEGTAVRFSTYIGGNFRDAAYNVAVNTAGEIVISGSTDSEDFPLLNPTQSTYKGSIDAFILKISPNGLQIRWSTYLGGSSEDYGYLLVSDKKDAIITAIHTNSRDLPTITPLQPALPGSAGIFLARITSLPRLELSTTTDQRQIPACSTTTLCATVPFTLTLRAIDGSVPANLVVSLPSGLTLLPNSLGQGATYDPREHQIRFSTTVSVDTPVILSYQAMLSPAIKPGAVLTTYAQADGPDHSVEAFLSVAVRQLNFRGTLVLIYASGNNGLATAMQRLLINAARGSTNPAILTLVLLDGPADNDTMLYRLGPGAERCSDPIKDTRCAGIERWSWPDDQLANPHNLHAYLTGALRAYPNASHRVLSLVGHGGGWSPPMLEAQPSRHGGQPGGMLWDDYPKPGRALSTSELGSALREATLETNNVFDLLFLDACSMAMAEVAYEVQDSARYLLASANWKWAAFPYDRHIPSAMGDGRAIGETWLRQEVASLRPGLYPFTYALIDLRQLQALRSATDALAASLMRPGGPLGSTEGKRRLLATAAATDRYDSNGDGAIRIGTKRDDADNYVDLGSLSLQLAQTFGESDPVVAQAARNLSAAVGNTVIASEVQNGVPWQYPTEHWTWAPSASLSIYLPLHYDDWRQRYYGTIRFSADGVWDELINSYWKHPLELSLAHIPPPNPNCQQDCQPPFTQLSLRPLTYLPIIAR